MSMASSSRFAVVVDTSKSPRAQLRPVPIDSVHLADAIWAARREQTRTEILPAQHRLMEETGRLDNFRRAAGAIDKPFQGRYYNDSDVYKWVEAAAWMLASDPAAEIEASCQQVVDLICAAQEPDGYLNTFFARNEAEERWSNLRDRHELYCAGHLIQAAIAHRRATGSEQLFAVASRLADHICGRFGDSDQSATSGHPEIEMALVELYREAGEPRYLEQARAFIDRRGRGHIGGSAYHQDRVPLREQIRLEGHAVRALYLNAGAADLFAEIGDEPLRGALETMWDGLVAGQLYVSGGVGARYEGEAFGDDYELPNARSYAETCAAIASVMWSWRMLQLDGDARYADLIETTMHNAILGGISADGQLYFYECPHQSRGQHVRKPWFECACCPPNLARFFAWLPGIFYSTRDDEVWVHQYAEGRATVAIDGGRSVEIAQRTAYPSNGDIELIVSTAGDYALSVRVPGWAEDGAELSVNGEPAAAQAGRYAQLRRTWRAGDRVSLHLPMPTRRIECHPHVEENAGRVALVRGPTLYCVQSADNEGLDPRDLELPRDVEFEAVAGSGSYDGMTLLRGSGEVAAPDPDWRGRLYRSLAPSVQTPRRSASFVAVPYHSWGNRGPTNMQVWLRQE